MKLKSNEWIGVVLIVLIVGHIFSSTEKDPSEGSCPSYASNYNCDYIKTKASYNVYYQKDVKKNDPKDIYFVTSVIGLSNCRDSAIYEHRREMNYRKKNWENWTDRDDNWSERSYICMLIKDGKPMEKHRLL
jgi:hypothetical protein